MPSVSLRSLPMATPCSLAIASATLLICLVPRPVMAQVPDAAAHVVDAIAEVVDATHRGSDAAARLLDAFPAADAAPAADRPEGRFVDAAAGRATPPTDASLPLDTGMRAIVDAGPVVAAADAGVTALAGAPPDPAPPSAGTIARVTLGLMAILALALLAGAPAVRAWERRSGLAMVTGSGLPFLALGLVARRPEVGILSESVLRDLRPLLEFGLGWIGFRVGTDFDLRQVERWPAGTVRAMAIESGCTALVVGVVSATVLAMVHPAGDAAAGNVVRNAVIIGACAAVSAPTGARLMAMLGLLDARGARQLRRVASLDDVMALLAVALVTAAFRPIGDSAWQLPPLGWVFLQVGMGVALGLLVWVAVRNARNPNEDVAMTLGALAFAAGMAGYVGFSPLVVCFVAGMVAANVPGGAAAGSWLSRPRFRDLERPIYMAFFVVVGALWSPHDRRGWIMLPIYVLTRAGGKLLGVRAARAALAQSSEEPHPDAMRLGPTASTWLAFLPSSAVSIAVVVSARSSYPEMLHGSLETVVIGGALLSELVFRLSARALAGRGASEQGGPVGALSIDHDNPDDDRSAGAALPPGATPGDPTPPRSPP